MPLSRTRLAALADDAPIALGEPPFARLLTTNVPFWIIVAPVKVFVLPMLNDMLPCLVNPPVPLIACGALLAGAGMALAISVWESTLQGHVPGESLSRVSSYDWFGSLAFYPLGLAVWGPVAAIIGISVSLWLAFGLAVALTLALLSLPDIRHLPAAAPPVPAPPPSPAGSPTP